MSNYLSLTFLAFSSLSRSLSSNLLISLAA
jgi:hypothetical protein